jgi:biopolymer transport protein ExbD
MQRIILVLFVIFLVSCDPTKTKPPETLNVVAPESKPNQIDPQDSAYLRIKISPNGYEIALFEKLLATTQIESLDTFLFANKDRINKSKVLVIGNISHDNLQQLKAILVKHDISKFSVSN